MFISNIALTGLTIPIDARGDAHVVQSDLDIGYNGEPEDLLLRVVDEPSVSEHAGGSENDGDDDQAEVNPPESRGPLLHHRRVMHVIGVDGRDTGHARVGGLHGCALLDGGGHRRRRRR